MSSKRAAPLTLLFGFDVAHVEKLAPVEFSGVVGLLDYEELVLVLVRR